jgi:hypothetical protein
LVAKLHAFLGSGSRPLHCTETFTPCIFIPILGTCFFAFQLNLGIFCLHFVDVSLNFDTLKLNWVAKICIFRISGINLSHLGADLSILGEKKNASGVSNTPKKIVFPIWAYFFWVLKFGHVPILKAVKRPEEHVMEMPGKLPC